ncbi:hypothetical protein DICA4_C07932 [Diutina catenulata]
MSTDSGQALMNTWAELFSHPPRSPIVHNPKEEGMDFEEVWFPSQDGVILEGWYIPAAKKSNKLIIVNHFLPGNRSGYPGHLDGFGNFGGFDVNFVKMYKHLHIAGYNVLCYDMRNHGRSAAGSGGLCAIGAIEYRDVIGSVRYAKSRDDTRDMDTSLFAICMGANSAIIALSKFPDEFKHIKSMLTLQPVSADVLIEVQGETNNVEDAKGKFQKRLTEVSGFSIDELTPVPYAKDIHVPVLLAQLKDDFLTKNKDVETIFESYSSKEKELYWINDGKWRFSGYRYFGEHPEKMLEFFGKYA